MKCPRGIQGAAGAKGRPSSEGREAGSREKLLAKIPQRPVPQTDTGGQVEQTEASERTVAKELGKTVP